MPHADLMVLVFVHGSVTDDETRVILTPVTGSNDCQNDYINASYIDVSMWTLIATHLM